MMTLEQIRDLISLISGDKGKEFSFDPVEFCDLLNNAQLKHFKRKIGLPEEYTPGMPLPRQSFEITQKITEDLRPFKRIIGSYLNNPIDLDDTGCINYPDDYYYITSISTYYSLNGKTYPRKVDVLSDSEYNDVTTSVTKAPSLIFPVCNFTKDKIRFSPIDIPPVSLTYLAKPTKPVYAVKTDNGYMEYDAANSTELEWDDFNIIDIITIMLGDMGISLKSGDVINYAENLKAKGV